jgi:carbon monoxide dehydrogenase subunit G
MEMTGQQLIPASPEITWRALLDTEVLKACIPGCEEMTQVSDSEYAVGMRAKIGPVSAKFKGKLTLSEVNPARSCTMLFEGQGGVAGHAKGQASVDLASEGDGTRLSYTAKAMVGGKMAQLGARLIDGVARKLSEDFFSAFNARVTGAQAAPSNKQ